MGEHGRLTFTAAWAVVSTFPCESITQERLKSIGGTQMAEEQVAECQACFTVSLGRVHSIEYHMRNSIYSYDCPSDILIKSDMFFCYNCRTHSEVDSDD